MTATQIDQFTVHFVITTGAGSPPISVVSWDFGDGTVLNSTSQTAVDHTYAAIGTYTVSATVQFNCGGSVTLIKSVPISPGFVGLGLAYIVIVAILLLASIFIRKNQRAKIGLAVAAVVLLALQISPYFKFLDYTLVASIMLLGAAIYAFILSILPGSKERPRGAWFALGVIAIVVWYFVTYGVL